MEKVREVKIITISEEIPNRSIAYHDFLNRGSQKPSGAYTPVEAEHPLFIIYACSATGIPRGSVFATGGFLVQARTSFDRIFQSGKTICQIEGILCTLNLSSAAGQSYGLWGPLLNGSCSIITAEGEDITIENLRLIADKCESPAFLTTPRMLTALKREVNDAMLPETRRFSLVASCGDILKPRLVSYAGTALTQGTEHVINLWIQSESGSALINTYPASELNRMGALGIPFFGVKPVAMSNLGSPCRTNESGQLVFEFSWPGMIRTIWGQPERFRDLYFHQLPGYFATNDGVRVDSEGFFWFMGRLDDVIKVRGQSLATSEIEAVLLAHQVIYETAVVSVPGDEGDTLVAFLAIERAGEFHRDTLESELTEFIKQRIGEFAIPNRYVFAHELPRTSTGKLVRRVLRRIATGDLTPDEDLSHVVNPHSVSELITKQGL